MRKIVTSELFQTLSSLYSLSSPLHGEFSLVRADNLFMIYEDFSFKAVVLIYNFVNSPETIIPGVFFVYITLEKYCYLSETLYCFIYIFPGAKRVS